MVDNLNKFYISREEVFNFLKYYPKMILNAGDETKQNKTIGTGLKI